MLNIWYLWIVVQIYILLLLLEKNIEFEIGAGDFYEYHLSRGAITDTTYQK